MITFGEITILRPELFGTGGLEIRIRSRLSGDLAGRSVDRNARLALGVGPEQVEDGRSDETLAVTAAQRDLLVQGLPEDTRLGNSGVTTWIKRLVTAGRGDFQVIHGGDCHVLAEYRDVNLNKAGGRLAGATWEVLGGIQSRDQAQFGETIHLQAELFVDLYRPPIAILSLPAGRSIGVARKTPWPWYNSV